MSDIKSDYKWKKKHYTSYSPHELMPGNGIDIKIPWELSRFHHLVTIAQAWDLTNNKKYSNEFFSQWSNWQDSNPFCYGINWTNTMEVAIRAVNLIACLGLLKDDVGYDKNYKSIIKSIRKHGLYIENNLEIGINNGKISAANHYLANICGLTIIGMTCQGLPESNRWVKTGMKALEKEIKRMVLDDGFFFESSTSYHRLATELFLYPLIIGQKTGFQFSNYYLQTLEKMLDIILFLTTPGGTIPQIGDNDDGRLLILSGYPDWDRHDHRYLLGLGAVIFDRGDYKIACGECPEEVFWLYGGKGVKKFNNIIPDKSPIESRAFADAGLYVIRNDKAKDYVLIRTISSHPNPPTAHNHNDTLSIELWINGEPVFIDPGTYCYTSDIDKRNFLRSSNSHNSAVINEAEINNLSKYPFESEWKTKFKCIEWSISSNLISFAGEHNSYSSRFQCIIQRTVSYDSTNLLLHIKDQIINDDKLDHTMSINWVLHPDQKIKFNELKNTWINQKNLEIKIVGMDSVSSIINSYSPKYGVVTKTKSLKCRSKVKSNKISTFNTLISKYR